MTQVLVLTSVGCHLCEDAKEGLTELASEYPMEIREVDLASAEGASLAERYHPPLPPAVIVNDNLFSSGRLPRRKMRKMLEKGVI